MLSFACISGQTDAHVVDFEYQTLKAKLQPQVIPSLKILADAAKSQGFQLAIVSGFRDFQRQSAIWNAKARGERPILDANEKPIAPGSLQGWPLVQAILRWSALPGASRHHWGTDFDVIDSAALKPGYKIQLTQQEASPNGIFGDFHVWLSEWLHNNAELGFCRPYFSTSSNKNINANFGVSPEPWHLSYQPIAAQIERLYNLSDLQALVQSSNLALGDVVLAHLQEIFDRFVVPR